MIAINKTKLEIKNIVSKAIENFKFELEELDFEYYYTLNNEESDVFKKDYLVQNLNLPYNLEMKVLIEYVVKDNKEDNLFLRLSLVNNKSDIVNNSSTKLRYDFKNKNWLNEKGE